MLTLKQIQNKVIQENQELTGTCYDNNEDYPYQPLTEQQILDATQNTYNTLNQLNIHITECCLTWDESIVYLAKNNTHKFYIDQFFDMVNEDYEEYVVTIWQGDNKLHSYMALNSQALHNILTKYSI